MMRFRRLDGLGLDRRCGVRLLSCRSRWNRADRHNDILDTIGYCLDMFAFQMAQQSCGRGASRQIASRGVTIGFQQLHSLIASAL